MSKRLCVFLCFCSVEGGTCRKVLCFCMLLFGRGGKYSKVSCFCVFLLSREGNMSKSVSFLYVFLVESKSVVFLCVFARLN